VERRAKDRRLHGNEQRGIDILSVFLERRGGEDRRADGNGNYRDQHDPDFPYCTCDECWKRKQAEGVPIIEIVGLEEGWSTGSRRS